MADTDAVPGVVLHDPDGLLGRYAWSQDGAETLAAALRRFQTRMSSPNMGQFAVHAGIALVDSVAEDSAVTARLARELGFSGAQPAVLVLLRAASVELAGSLLRADLPGGEEHILEAAEWHSAEMLCQAYLRNGDFVAAAEAAIKGILLAITGSVATTVPHVGFRQKQLEKWESKYQVGEVWLNMCGDKLCRELVLGDVRQLSDGFERYYHEALVYPALNLLGPHKKRKVLILGGGDGGVATSALRFDTVEQVINVDIDSSVTSAATRWFPKVAAGLNDSRCEMLHLDAFTWVEEQHNRGAYLFDLVIIDFTDEPIQGAWSTRFFSQLKGLLAPDGLVVQNVGTIMNPGDTHKLFRVHAAVFTMVFPVHAMIPDYLGPYVLLLSSVKEINPAEVIWDHWQRQQIMGQYYGGEMQHRALFMGIPADLSHLLGVSVDLDDEGSPRAALPVPQPLPPFKKGKSGREQVILRAKGLDGSEVKVVSEAGLLSLHQDRDLVLDSKPLERDEVLLLPALVFLGDRAKSVLVLGGGTCGIATLALQWPTVQRIVLVEVDEIVVEVVRKHFPKQAEVLSDPRVELIVEDVLTWLPRDNGSFDLVVVNMLDQPWLPPRRTTRLPRTKAFYRQLRAKMAPGGLLSQEAGSAGMPEEFGTLLSIHRRVFSRTWPLAMSSSSPQPTALGDEFDGLYFRLPRLLLLSTEDALSPLQVDWRYWPGFAAASKAATTYYHPRLHDSLFVLPAELQRRFDALPPAAPSEEFEAASSQQLVHTLMTEAWGCSAESLDDPAAAGALLRKLAALGDLTELGHLEHKFQPQGLTALVLVSESHLSVVDVVSCKPLRPSIRKAMDMEVQLSLGCRSVLSKFALRGRGLSEAATAPLQQLYNSQRPQLHYDRSQEL